MRFWNNIFGKLNTTGYDVYFDLFKESAANLVAMSDILYNGISEYDTYDENVLQTLSDLEHKNDELTHTLFLELGRKFVKTSVREDLSSLASALDDIADYMYSAAKYIYLYKSPEIKIYSEFAHLIRHCCVEIQNALRALREFKDINAARESIIKINSMENIGDELLTQAMLQLFESGDAVRIIKVKTVLDFLEEVTDRAEDVANILENIILKYA